MDRPLIVVSSGVTTDPRLSPTRLHSLDMAGKPSRTDPPEITNRRADRDRRVNQAERLRRVLGVLQLIQSRGRYNARAIAEELSCSKRTVYRDLEVLNYAGVTHYFDEVEQCYRVATDCRLPSLPLTDADAGRHRAQLQSGPRCRR